MSATETSRRYRVIGMDCADDAREIEEAARTVASVREARVSVASQILTVQLLSPNGDDGAVEQAVSEIGYHLDPLTGDGLGPEASGVSMHLTTAYRRALWIVVLINVGYGLVELGAGFLSDSQALKADALDFVGDGLITFLGIIAIGWGLAWRARAALLQGIFLGLLGGSVLIDTLMRVQGGYRPEADLMSLFGIIALVVNIASTVVLLPHRSGDANVRAVWLFSRNDAIGNLGVVIAAGIVAWSGMDWPDVVAALVISGLFLHSAWLIIADSRRDLAEATA